MVQMTLILCTISPADHPKNGATIFAKGASRYVNDVELNIYSNLKAGKSQARQGKEPQDIYEQHVCDGRARDSSIHSLLSLGILMYEAELLCCAIIRASQGPALSMLSHESPEIMQAGSGWRHSQGVPPRGNPWHLVTL
jgi:hypothetical protein